MQIKKIKNEINTAFEKAVKALSKKKDGKRIKINDEMKKGLRALGYIQ